MFKDDLFEWSSNVDLLYKDVKSFIDNNVLPKVVTFDTASTRKGLYESYANVVDINNSISEFLVKVHEMLMLRSQFRRLLRSEGYGNSVTTLFNTQIDEISERITVIDKLLQTYRNAVEAQLRFYQSVQYIMSSPRLTSYE